jgi:hypothetical protein
MPVEEGQTLFVTLLRRGRLNARVIVELTLTEQVVEYRSQAILEK